ncbi:MAG: hypothetical protein KDC34_08275 [Saprospiraceae bacterium]|nr:hypothetical protein [Saprospiraceae bacterium]
MRLLFFICVLLFLFTLPTRKVEVKETWGNKQEYLNEYVEFMTKIEIHLHEMNETDWVIANELYRSFSRNGYTQFIDTFSDQEKMKLKEFSRIYLKWKASWTFRMWRNRAEDFLLDV